jgi:hypothetical protein
MSFSEILITLIVSFLVIKPEDIRQIISKLKQCRTLIINTKKEILGSFDPDLNPQIISNAQNIESEVEELNFYLEKICDLSSEYKGDYILESVKEHYHGLMNRKISSELKKNKM